MNVINAAITVRPESKDVSFFWSVPAKTNGKLQILSDGGTDFLSVPINNPTGHTIGLSLAIPFSSSISQIPSLVIG